MRVKSSVQPFLWIVALTAWPVSSAALDLDRYSELLDRYSLADRAALRVASELPATRAGETGCRPGPDTIEPEMGEAEPREVLPVDPQRYPVAPGLTVGGSFKDRVETKDDFGFDTTGPIDDEDYLLSQLRLNVEWKPPIGPPSS